MTKALGVLRLWRHRFSTLLRGDGNINAETRKDSEPVPLDDEGVDISPHSHNEVRVAIQLLKNNKAAGTYDLIAELFKTGGDELVTSMHKFICRIWLEKSNPCDWNLSVLCPVLKKGDPTICANFRGISAYRI